MSSAGAAAGGASSSAAAAGPVVHAGTPTERDALVHPIVFDGARLPWAALVAAALVVALEVATFLHREAFLDDVFFLAERKRARLASGAARDEVVLFGDSMFLGVRPGDVAEALGVAPDAAASYVWPFFGMEGFPIMLRGLLDHQPPPRVLVTNLMPQYLALPRDYLVIDALPFSRSRAFAVLPMGAYLRTLWAERAWRLLAFNVRSLLTPPTATWREGWRRVLAAWAGGAAWPERPYKERRWEAEYARHGAYLLFDREVAPADPVAEFARHVPLEAVDDPVVMARFEEMVAMAGEAGVVVVVVNPPVSRALASHLEAIGVAATYRAAMEAMAARHPHLVLVEPLAGAAPDGHFADISHLNRTGDAAWRPILREALAAHADDIASRSRRLRGR